MWLSSSRPIFSYLHNPNLIHLLNVSTERSNMSALSLFRHIIINKSRKFRALSMFKFISTEAQQEQQSEIVRQEKIQLKRPEVEKMKRPPFAKDLCLGILNTELLAPPEILDNEHLTEFEGHVKHINEIFKSKGDLAKNDETVKISDGLLQDLKDLGLFGRLIPAQYGGLGLTMTEYTRLNEVIGLDWSIAAILCSHELLATQALLHYGTEAQKEKYLPDLASGNRMIASCIFESQSGCDMTKPKTEAKWLSEHNCYSLSGTKSWVTNGQIADMYMVFCKIVELTDMEEKTVMFLVDSKSKGVTVSPLNDKIGLKGSNAAIVQFNDVAVPKENRIGSVGGGLQVLNKVMETLRFGMSSVTIGTLKSLLDYITDYAINTDRHDKALSDLELVRETLTKITRSIYAMESVSYYTAAIMDCTENADCTMECFISKVFNSEGTLYCLRKMMKILGCSSLSENQLLQKLHGDALALAGFDGPNDILKLYIGLLGCQYAGAKRAELVMQSRNPFFFPMVNFKSLIRGQRIVSGRIKFTQDIAGHLHPSFILQANNLEQCVQRLDFVVEKLLTKHGQLIVENQFDPTRIADMLIDIYVSTAVLARSSRSYCIGLRNSDNERRIAVSICNEAYNRINKAFQDITMGEEYIFDSYAVQTGSEVVRCKGYFPEHPLKHNF